MDCVIFGFSTSQLKVLLIEREYLNNEGLKARDFKLPGDFISTREDLDRAACRTLEELTGLHEIYLEQFAIFGQPYRISRPVDLNWLNNTTGMEIDRVVTSAYYALINITETRKEYAIKNNAAWWDVNALPELAFDHEEIIRKGLDHLRLALRNEPIGFELLPEKFTIRELQTLYEIILDTSLDNRNFRKKILKAKFLEQLEEKQAGVAHKPAYFYRFNKTIYEQHKKNYLGFNF